MGQRAFLLHTNERLPAPFGGGANLRRVFVTECFDLEVLPLHYSNYIHEAWPAPPSSLGARALRGPSSSLDSHRAILSYPILYSNYIRTTSSSSFVLRVAGG